MDKDKQFEHDRATSIGGSDTASLLQLDPFGCKRMLHYDKSGVKPDYAQVENYHMKRGKLLEPVAVKVYEEETGRFCQHTSHRRHPEHNWMGVHIDRVVHRTSADRDSQYNGPGVLEVKCPSVRAWQAVKANGLPAYVYVQAQWGLAITGWEWGSATFFTPELMRCETFDFLRDDELTAKLIEDLQSFVATLPEVCVAGESNPFDRLERTDKRCAKCQWRKHCQGLGEVPSWIANEEQVNGTERFYLPSDDLELDESLLEHVRLRAAYLDSKAAYDEAHKELKSRLENQRAQTTTGARFYWSHVKVKAQQKPRGSYGYEKLTVLPNKMDEGDFDG